MARVDEAGMSLLEVMIAATVLLVVAVSSFAAISHGSQILQQNEQATGASNIQRVAQSYLRSLDYGTLETATESTLTTAIARQLSPTDWSQLGASGSVQVTRLALGSRLVTVDLSVTYGLRVATTSFRVAERGINP